MERGCRHEEIEVHGGKAAFAFKQTELGTPEPDVCRKMGASQATFYSWKKKFGGVGPSELRRLRRVEEECNRLKRLVADLSLDKAMLQDVLAKNLLSLRDIARL